MANSRYDVTINADNKGLSTAVNKSMDELNKLDSVANGLFSNLTGPLNNLRGGLNTINTMSPALRGLGLAGLAAGAGLAAINKASSTVNTLNEISTNTGVSIEMLQKLQKEFKATGMEVEKFGDINKDALDHIGDSLRNAGGGVADDLKEWGIGLETLAKYSSDAEGGIKAVIDVYYKMQQAGKSKAEITNVMETMASDASHLITTLEQYGSSQEALNAINSQGAGITSEMAEKYAEFDRNVKTLSSNVDTLIVEGVTPLVSELNELWEIANRDWTEADIWDALKHFWYDGDTPLAKFNRYVDGIPQDDPRYSTSAKAQLAQLKAQADGLNKDIKKAVDDAEQQTKNLKDLKEKQDKKAAEDAKKAADKAAREQEQAAAKAKAAYDKMMSERVSYLQTMTQTDIAIISQGARGVASQMNQMQQTLANIDKLQSKGIISLEQATARRNQLMANSSKEFKDQLTMNPDDIGEIAQGVEQAYQMQLEQLYAKQKQGLVSTQEYNSQLEAIEQDHQSKMSVIQDIDANSVNTKNLDALGFATDEQMMALRAQQLEEQIARYKEQNQQMYDAGLISHEEFLKQKETLDKAYSVKSKAIALAEIQTKMQMYDGFAQGMSGVISGIAGENSKAAQAAFAVAKGTSIATGMLNAYESATTAMAKYPGPLGYALAASSYAQVIGQVMQMKSVGLTGMAHDGLSEVPREGTWLLDGGERVVDQRTNGDLKDFLDNNKDTGGQQTIDASIHINGNVTDQKWFAEQLKKQQKTISSIVQDQNRRKL
ncbi:TPA: hypothetical protein ACOEA3_000924 [Enterobacter hormaechei subsp. xiangfangensis]|uniref:hypothetical protein n=1 Tax=Enterobacter cloacae TaxID=550 RepID=UPI0032AF2666